MTTRNTYGKSSFFDVILDYKYSCHIFTQIGRTLPEREAKRQYPAGEAECYEDCGRSNIVVV